MLGKERLVALKKWHYAFAVLLCVTLLVSIHTPASAANSDKTTKFRVYQNDNILMEFSDMNQAADYAKQWSNSHVEEIGTRKWVWDNFPRYRLYQYDNSLPDWEFATLQEAIDEGKNWSNSSVRDMQSGGWVWSNYPKFRLHQGETTLDDWEFADLKSAVAEAKKWANAHIIDLSSNRWVWDNYKPAKKKELRSGPKIYQVLQNGYTQEDWNFSFLQDAVDEGLHWSNSYIVNKEENKVVYSNLKQYKVYQNDVFLDEFVGLDEAINYAKQWAHAKILKFQREIWNNYAYYQVHQNGKWIGEFQTIPNALAYAVQYSNASIKTYHNQSIWNNFRKLQFWAWNGTANADAIRNQVLPTQGLDVDSPSWFVLKDEEGGLTDNSNKDTVALLKRTGIAVHPLVSNQFDSSLTSAFLSSGKAQDHFIRSLVDRAAELGVNGLNIDFENISGKDRNAFTAFIRSLTDYAHQKNLAVSIDLPRGSVKWNHLTAFDHEKLGAIVDYVVTMAYDQHYSGSPTPGSVSGLQWAEQGIVEFLSYGIPRDKLIMGVPFYSREWQVDESNAPIDNKAIYMKSIPEITSGNNAKMMWDARFNQYEVKYEKDGSTRVFWVENEDSMKARLDIAKKYDLAGVAAWRLGYEPADLWQALIRAK